MACRDGNCGCGGNGDGGPDLTGLTPGQIVAATGKPLLSSTVDLSRSLAPGQFAPVVRYYYLTAAQRNGLNGKPRSK